MIKLVNSQEIKKWFEETVIGLTQKQLKEFVDAGIPIEVFCIESEEKPLYYEIFVDMKDSVGDQARRMVVINRRKGRRFYRAETACRLILKDLGFSAVQFYGAEKRKEEGLILNTDIEENT